MSPITASVEIDRPPQDVFDYVTDLKRQSEWQAALLEVELQTEGPTRVGTKAVDVRKVAFAKERFPFEITEHDPPNRSSFQVTGGPVRPHGTVTFTPLDGGKRTRIEFTMELIAHGIFGKLLLPLANRDAGKQVPRDLETLKQLLESS